MPLYEHVFLARPDVSSSQVEALTKEYSDVITEGGGKVGKTEYWGLKSLAYKIKKNRKAHYVLMNLDAPAPAVAEMERRMGLSTDVIRFLTVKVAAHETEPSAMMRKSDRDDRGDRGDRGGFRGGGFRGDRGGGFRGGPRPDREGGERRPRGEGGGEGHAGEGERRPRGEGSTFRARPQTTPRPEREGGEAPRPPRAPRTPRGSGSSGESEG